jgi:hypothetical protein
MKTFIVGILLDLEQLNNLVVSSGHKLQQMREPV